MTEKKRSPLERAGCRIDLTETGRTYMTGAVYGISF